MQCTTFVTYEKRQGLGIATLNRESALNSLNLEMVESLLEKLTEWQNDSSIRCVLIKGAGKRSFCSGGDVKQVCLSLQANDEKHEFRFFSTEYKLDYLIHTYQKPILVLGHGLVLGGGIGLIAGATVRIGTQSSSFGMPEILIGLFPDVGGSYFLNQMPQGLGLFLALTASRMNAADAISIGFINTFIPDEKCDELIDDLTKISNSVDQESIASQIEKYTNQYRALLPEPLLKDKIDRICTLFGDSTLKPAIIMERILSLKNDPDPFFQKAAATFEKGSPTSAFLIVEQLKRGRSMSLQDCFKMELDLAIQCCRHHDFKEGVRALLIDKDQNPKWNPENLSLVSKKLIAEHFEPISD